MSQDRRWTNIGLVDMDTSHAELWIPLLRDMGYKIAGLFDSGAVYPSGYAQAFAAKHNIAYVFDNVEAMAASSHVDIAMIHSCNWDVHAAKARPLIEAGKSVFINKPLAGHIADLLQIRAWVQSGARISGGSSLRTCMEIQEQREVADLHGPVIAVYAGCGVDEFYYGVHAYSMAVGLLGGGIDRARHLGVSQHGQHHVEIEWQDGRQAILLMGGGNWLPFHASVIYKDTVKQFEANNDTISKVFLECLMPYLSRETDELPFSADALIEPELAAIAANVSLHNAGAWVPIADLDEKTAGYDGGEFCQKYRIEALEHYVGATR